MSVKHSPLPVALPRRSPIAVIRDVVTRLTPRVLRRTKLEEVVEDDTEETENSDAEATDADDNAGSNRDSVEEEAENSDYEEYPDDDKKSDDGKKSDYEEYPDDEVYPDDDKKSEDGKKPDDEKIPEEEREPERIYPALPKEDFKDFAGQRSPPPDRTKDPWPSNNIVTPRKPATKVKAVRLPTRVQPKRERSGGNFIFPEIRLRRPKKVRNSPIPSSVVSIIVAAQKRGTKKLTVKQELISSAMPSGPSTPNGGKTMALVNAKDKAAYKTHFDKIFRSTVASGMNKDEAKIYADGAAMGMINLLNGQELGQQVATKPKLDSELWTGYLSTQQQQQTISLLAPVVPFSGNGPTRFEDWIAHFESVMDTADWDDDRRVKLLCSKLTHLATDSVNTFRQSHPIGARSYKRIKQCLNDRFHGSDDRVHYSTEYKNCVHMPGESVRDYGCRLQKLFLFAYPMIGVPSADILSMREKMLMDKFVDGLVLELRQCVRFKEYANVETLIRATERYAASREEIKREKRQVEFVNAISPRNPQSADFDAMFKANQKLMSDMVSQTSTAIENLCSTFRKNVNVNDKQNAGRGSGWNQGGYSAHQQSRPFCDFCKTNGHTRARCRRDPENRNCFRCGQPGHFSRECPSYVNPTGSGFPQQHLNRDHPSLPRGQGN